MSGRMTVGAVLDSKYGGRKPYTVNMMDAKDMAFSALWQKAYAAGMAAGEAVACRPMTVRSGDKSWFVPDGVCGFAWVSIKPGNSAFAKWGKAKGLFSKAYSGGVHYWAGLEFNQSMQRKEAFAEAVAKVLSEAGINAYADSRMD